ncbi:anthranilate synthase component I [Bacillus songklensis]|uniref:Anthranilate synthase component 1 n=1 Tax=Bacillus songklensis TaxID=1069116 RepID=A0ABV8B0P9_9BACI
MNQSQNVSTFLEDSFHHLTIPIARKMYLDALTPVEMFQRLQEEAVYLLESNDSSSPWGNYSFIGLNPFLYLEEEKGTFRLSDANHQPFCEKGSFKEIFDESLKILKLKQVDIPLPFKGGAVGYMGYDAVSMVENISLPANNDLAMKRFYFVYCETILAYHHQQKELTMIHYVRLNGQETEQEKRSIYEKAIGKMNDYIKQLSDSTVKAAPLVFESNQGEVDFTAVQSTYEKEKFLQDVDTIKEYIRSGDIFQAVLSQRFEMPVNVSGFQIYRVLRLVNPSPYLFYIKVEGAELVGSSPERLIQIENGHLEIHPIAGTRRRGRTKEEEQKLQQDLLHDQKEQAEHYMLVDLARNDIGRVAQYGSVQTPVLMELVTFSHVMHLISKVTGRLAENVHPVDALFSAFPAGTVSGAPKIRAMQILSELEPTARNVYAGTVAYLDFDGNIDSCIAIRTIMLKDERAYVQAGAGIVADSIPELEWKETRNKASALIRTIQLANQLYEEKGDLYVSRFA